MTETSRIIVAAGPRAVEARLLAEVDRALPAGELPRTTLLVVVPSHPLRRHVLARLAERRPAWLGLEVLTLAGLARVLLARAGRDLATGEILERVLVRRLAAREPALSRALGRLDHGYDEIGGAVRDLLDAGFVDEHAEGVAERLLVEREAVGGEVVGRAQAIVRVAGGLRGELARLGLADRSAPLAEAAELLAADPERALPRRTCLVHGFADLTGVGADLVAALVRHRTTIVLLDEPPDLDGGRAAWTFGARLRERLAGLATVESLDREAADVSVEIFEASDPAREARAAVAWIDAGPSAQRAERTAIVARDLDGQLSLRWRELDRRGLAASAEPGMPGPRARRVAAILEALRDGDELELGVALEIGRERLAAGSEATVAELRLAFALRGARRLGPATDRRIAARPVALPTPAAIEARPDAAFDEVARRTVPADDLSRARRWLGRFRAILASMRRPAPASRHARALRALLRHALPPGEAAALARPLELLARPGIAGLETSGEEWRAIVESAWHGLELEPLGGGGGIALLTVTQARALTFDRLVLVGLERDRFPRAVRPDPLLPDSLRSRLRELLPDLPVKAEGHAEERFLFAQLLAAADRVALFRSASDGRGRPLAPSPLLDELRRARGLGEPAVALAPPPCALDAAIDGALRDGLAGLSRALAAALTESDARFGVPDGEGRARSAAARAALLPEHAFDPADARYRRLGPYAGAVGAVAAVDPRRRTPGVTTLEAVAACGWRAFLEKVLALESLPELGESLPSLPGRLVGSVVHEVLERMVGPELRGLGWAAATAREPRAVPWPGEAELDALVHAAARRQLAREALDPALFETTLVREALERLELARASDWSGEGPALLAVEVAGEAVLEIDGIERRLPFRVDRVDREGGELRLTDYKTGRPVSSAVRASTRATHLDRAIDRGEALQLPLYVAGAGSAARARYLYLSPRVDDRRREHALGADELDAGQLRTVLSTLLRAWSSGAFTPRLLDADRTRTFEQCAWCAVREACLQGDSSARLRFLAWLDADPGDPVASDPIDAAARAWWSLRPARRGRSGGS